MVWWTVAVTSVTAAPPGDDFRLELVAAGDRYQAKKKEEELSATLKGELAHSISELESLIPESQMSAGDHLALGTLFYRLDEERSFAHHRRAYELTPRPETAFLLARHFHRRGDCARALSLYREAGRLLPTPYFALMAGCLVAEKSYKDAAETWAKARYHKNRMAVNAAIFEVFDDLKPAALQDALIHAVRGGRQDKVRDLLLLAMEWKTSWWENRPNSQVLSADIEILEQTFGRDSTEAQDARLLRDAVEAAKQGPEPLRLLLVASGFLGSEHTPRSTFMTRRLMVLALGNGLASVEDWDRRFRPELERRVGSRSGTSPEDKDALDILADIATRRKDFSRLKPLNWQGWTDFHDPNYAVSFLIGSLSNDPDEPPDFAAYLERALKEFPQDGRFHYMAHHEATKRAQVTPDLVARCILAEYHGLLSHPLRHASVLDDLYKELGAFTTLPSLPSQ